MIALVGCCKTKRNMPCRAKDMYIGNIFIARRAFVEHFGLEWYILSAKYGLLHPNDTIAPYNETLIGKSKNERREWTKKIIDELERLGKIKTGDEILILGGREYSEFFQNRFKIKNPWAHKGILCQIHEMKDAAGLYGPKEKARRKK